MLTVTAVDVTVPIVLIPLLNSLGMNIENNSQSQITIALIVLTSTTLLNIFGVRLVAIVNNTGVVFEILGMVVFAIVLLLFYAHQSPGVVFDTTELNASGNPWGTFMAAMFMSLFVIYGFDTASTLAEETKNPRREAPRAVIAAIVGGFNQVRGAILGGLLLGVIDNFAAAYLSAQYRAAIPLLLLIVVILFRPQGLLGRAEERTV